MRRVLREFLLLGKNHQEERLNNAPMIIPQLLFLKLSDLIIKTMINQRQGYLSCYRWLTVWQHKPAPTFLTLPLGKQPLLPWKWLTFCCLGLWNDLNNTLIKFHVKSTLLQGWKSILYSISHPKLGLSRLQHSLSEIIQLI